MRTRIKICGLGCAQDALAAAYAGADAIGLVFYPPSSRALALPKAREIAQCLPAFVSRVALFLDADAAAVENVIAQIKPDALQFHGREEAAFCRAFGLPYLKAVSMQQGVDIARYVDEYADARGLLLDSHTPGQAGGSGVTFDWARELPRGGPPLILAGGLHPDNVAEAIRTMRPYGVDVSSGVESAPGVKDPARIRNFIHAVQHADCEPESS